jgi:putative FmdB family regulatory protein
VPSYDYRCAARGHLLETFQGNNDPGPAACPACGAAGMRRVVTSAAIVFKGTGWAKKERRDSSPASRPAGDQQDGNSTKDAAEGNGPKSGGTNEAPKGDGPPSSSTKDATPDASPKAAAGTD